MNDDNHAPARPIRRAAACTAIGTVLVAILGSTVPSVAQEQDRRAAPGLSAAALRAAAAKIDRLVEAELRRRKIAPNPNTDDATFARRAYLAIVGRIPTVDETRRFLASKSGNQRGALIDLLLGSPGYVSHSFNYWADLLRAKTRLAQQTSGEPYIDWIKQAIADNTPYDEMVRELLTASGPAHARGNGATGYYLRDRGMPEDNMSNTVRVFLGTRLECAQCHNHPFDAWTQKQFFEMAAFTGGLLYRDNELYRSETGQSLMRMGRELRNEQGRNAARAFGRLMRPLATGISGSGTGLIRLPHDYQYDDARPNQVIRAQPMFGPDAGLDVAIPRAGRSDRIPPRRRANARNRRRMDRFPEVDSRAAYADWMTSPENPRFTKVIANRMWKRAFGIGLIEPVDDVKDDTQASNPALMAFLEKLMVDLDYDLEQFQRVLHHTRTWQRQATPYEPIEGESYAFQGPVLRRMTAEQMWDSMLTLVVPDLDDTLAPPHVPSLRAQAVYRQYEQAIAMSEDQWMERVDRQVLRYTDPDEFREQQRREAAQRNQRRRQIGALMGQLDRARDQGDRARERRILARLEQLGLEQDQVSDMMGSMGRARGRPGRNQLARASDLPSPAPAGHFLRQLGQSDREQIEAANSDANVPQVLTMLNGFVDQYLLRRRGAALGESIAGARGADAKIETAFLGTLNRKPTNKERAMWRADVERDPQQACRDLMWTLVNTHEFKFVQ